MTDRRPAPIRVVICDDAAPIRALVSAWLEDVEDIEEVANASDGKEAVDRVHEFSPDVLVLDLDMPVYDGVYTIEQLLGDDPTFPIVVYSGSSGTVLEERAREAGATRFVTKTSDLDDLVDAIRDAAGARAA